MIQVYSQDRVRLCLLRDYKGLAITKSLADGDQEMSFSYPRNGPAADSLQNENYIVTQDDEFVLKEVSGGSDWIKCRAILNLEELQGKSYASFETVEKTVAECLGQALLGTGWNVGVCEITKKRTIRKDSVCTAIDIIEQCISTYKVEVVYHTKTKTIDIVEQVGSDKGAYFMEAINLRKPPTFTYTSDDFYTQIRPIGKDGLTISVNGKDYLENHSYSPKNLMYTWKDERYTSAASLAEDAELKLADMCAPVKTYEADVIDLAKASGGEYEVLAYSLGDTVTLISKKSAVKEKMRIVKITEYPQTPQKNDCQLSSAKKTFADMQEDVIAEAVQEATGTAAANTSEQVESESDISSEELRLSLESMKTEVLKDVEDTYLKQDEAESVAGTAAEFAANEAKKYMDEQLECYATEKKLSSEITAAKKEINQEMSDMELRLETEISNGQTEIREELKEQQQKVEDALETAETKKNDITAPDGTVWRIGITGEGLLYLEQIGGEEDVGN
jgi:phage minor structural protein